MSRNTRDNLEAEKRQLRLAIARSRRRIDREARQAGRAARQLASWRTYVRRYPAAALASGLGFGWALSEGLRPHRIAGLLAGRLTHRAGNQLAELLLRELSGAWNRAVERAESSPGVDQDG